MVLYWTIIFTVTVFYVLRKIYDNSSCFLRFPPRAPRKFLQAIVPWLATSNHTTNCILIKASRPYHILKMASAPETKPFEPEIAEKESNTYSGFIIFTAIAGVALCFAVYRRYRARVAKVAVEATIPQLPKIRKDMTVAELRQYDGNQADGRVLVAVNGWIFDVTRGRRFYGPGGPYAAFGGKDASRGLATFSVESSDKEYDDLSDLNSMEMESVKEWEAQFREKYDLVGRLLKPGEEPISYSDEETEDPDTAATEPTDKKDK